MTILDELEELAETSYKEFNRKIVPTRQTTLGVRLPVLRKIAKRIAHDNPMEFITSDKENSYELIMLEGLALSYMDASFKELVPLAEAFLEKVDNWAQVDSTICNFKNIKKENKVVLQTVSRWLKSDDEFIVRAALVILLAHYVEKDNLQMIFNYSEEVRHTGYYVYMANAWLISVCMAKFPDETLDFLRNNSLDSSTHNKAIQKSRESYRVSEEHKALLNNLKRK